MRGSQSRTCARLTSLPLAMILALATLHAQSKLDPYARDEPGTESLRLLSDLHGLTARAKQIQKPLARAMAEAEIADALWWLERDQAKELLRDAYAQAFPDGAEQQKLSPQPPGAPPQMPNSLDRARSEVRARVLKVAARDKDFARALMDSIAEKLGAYEAHITNASLARNAVQEGDLEAARNYIDQSIEADPTQIAGPLEINQLALKDRAAADAAIISYINRLSQTTLSVNNQSLMRVNFSLYWLINPESDFINKPVGISPPGPAVMRAYVTYMLNSLAAMGQQSTATFNSSHIQLVMIYPLLKRYAPELMPQFLALEQQSRRPGENFSLPSEKSRAADYKAKFDKQVERELDSDRPDETIIRRVISSGDFAKAKKLLDKLADDRQKTELTEILNAEQSINLANKGDLFAALKIAESLINSGSIMRVFPVIAGKCIAQNDDTCTRDSVNQAIKQLKKADQTPFAPPAGMPASFSLSTKGLDQVLSSLGALAGAVISAKDDLALDVLDELVVAANHSEADTSEGRTGFETSLFRKLSEKNAARTAAAAIQLQDPLRQIVALAAIDQGQVDKVIKAERAQRKSDQPRGN